MSGVVGGVVYVAARTNGDGACGLHALFGQCHLGELLAPSIRSRVQHHMPLEFSTVLDTITLGGRIVIGQALDQLLEDAMTAATRVVVGGVLQDEQALLWDALSSQIREDVHSLAVMKQYETANASRVLELLRLFFQEIFQPAHAETVVRCLCIQLDYLQPTAPDDLLNVPPSTPGLRAHEGPRGNLELLHPCAENTTMTKFQALFDSDPVYERYRIAFFLNSANRQGGQDWLLGAVEIAADLLTETSPGGRQLLLDARSLLKQRFNCFGCLERPPSCTRHVAWRLLRELVLHDDYYLSVSELLVFAVTAGFSLSLYRYVPTPSAEDALQLLSTYSADGTEGHAHVVLNIAEDRTSLRGHFSRLFTEGQWEAHREACAAEELVFSDTSLSSQSSEDEESHGAAEDTAANAIADAAAPPQDEPMEEDADADLESLSDVSDNSDLFHVAARPSETPRTLEDEELAIIDSIVPHLRDYPLLPPRAKEPTESFADVASGQRLPALHCGFKRCPMKWTASLEDINFHFDMERLLYCHLEKEHKDREMAKVPKHEWDDNEAIARALWPDDPDQPSRNIPRTMNALAYYTAAVCAKERCHVPLIGPSLDRRMLSLLTRLCRSETVEALVCVGCAQIHTCVKSWTRPWPECLSSGTGTWRLGGQLNIVRYYEVGHTLLKFLRENRDAFSNSFELSKFIARYGGEGHADGNPFRNCEDFKATSWEWKRRLTGAGGPLEILCCPEDVVKSTSCRHDEKMLCKHCLIPLCAACYSHCQGHASGTIPMVLGNDNFWGYTTEVLYKYQVRWVEAAIVMPIWSDW